jgi:hypothetical protein
MSWGAQNRSEDAKNPSVAGVRLIKPEPDCCPIQPYRNILSFALNLALIASETSAVHVQPAPRLRPQAQDRQAQRVGEPTPYKTRATSEHAARLESRAGTLGTYIV